MTDMNIKVKKSDSKEIEHRSHTMKMVVQSLKTAEEKAFYAPLPALPELSTFKDQSALLQYQQDLLREKHLNYLAVRLQREKMEQIQKFLTHYQCILHNVLSLKLFYCHSYLELTENLPNPSTHLQLYIDTLVTHINQYAKSDKNAMNWQICMGILMYAVAVSLFLVSVLLIESSLLALMAAPFIFFPVMVIPYLADVQRNMMARLKFINHDGVPPLNKTYLKFGSIDTWMTPHHEEFSYYDPHSKKLLCAVYQPGIYYEAFELKMADEIKNYAIESANQQFTSSLFISKNIKDTIQNRPFSRTTPDVNLLKPHFHQIISEDKVALKHRFFSMQDSNNFGAEAVQNEIKLLSQHA